MDKARVVADTFVGLASIERIIVEAGNIDTLLSQPGHPYSRALLACVPKLGRPDKPLVPIPGQPLPLNALPAGCHFAQRCDYAQDLCRTGEITLRPLRPAHSVRCIRAGKLNP